MVVLQNHLAGGWPCSDMDCHQQPLQHSHPLLRPLLGGEQQQGRVSAEDVVKKSLEMQQPMLLRVSRSSLRAIPRPGGAEGRHQRSVRPEVGEEAKELNGSLAMEDSLKGAIEDTGFVML